MINQQLGSLSDGVEGEGGKEWWKKVGVWNQVFRVRCGGRTAEIQEESEQGEIMGPDYKLRGLLPLFLLVTLGFHAPPTVIRAPLPPHLSLDMTQCPPTHPVEASDSSSDSEADSIDVTVGKPGSLVRLAACSADWLVICQSVGRSVGFTMSIPCYRSDWEKFQSNVSRQLLARYFYSCEFL